MDLAVGYERAVGPGEDNVGDPVADVVAAADGENDLPSGVVCGNIAGDASDETAGRTPALANGLFPPPDDSSWVKWST